MCAHAASSRSAAAEPVPAATVGEPRRPAPIRPADAAAIAAAAECLRTGALVVLPTETVYGLAADARRAEAVARLYAAKARPRFNPLIAHVADVDGAARYGVLDDRARALAAAFWPGPLTLVVPTRTGPDAVCDLARAGLDTIALRAPAHPVARAVLAAVDGPLAMPSANPSGGLSPTRAADVTGLDGHAAFILDGGPARHGVESTVVALLDGPAAVLRPGPITPAALEAVIGPIARHAADGSTPQTADGRPVLRSPGGLARHYAPARARLRLNASAPRPREAYLGFGPGPFSELNLSPSGDLTEAARNLFTALRALDAAGYARIAVAPIPRGGLGDAIADRLTRAATPAHDSDKID